MGFGLLFSRSVSCAYNAPRIGCEVLHARICPSVSSPNEDVPAGNGTTDDSVDAIPIQNTDVVSPNPTTGSNGATDDDAPALVDDAGKNVDLENISDTVNGIDEDLADEADENSKTDLEDTIQNLTLDLIKVTNKLNSITDRMAQQLQNIADTEEELNTLKDEKQNLDKTLEEREKKLKEVVDSGAQAGMAQYDQAKLAVDTTRDAVSKKAVEIRAVTRILDSQTKRNDDLNEQKKKLNDELASLNEKLEKMKEALKKLKDKEEAELDEMSADSGVFIE